MIMKRQNKNNWTVFSFAVLLVFAIAAATTAVSISVAGVQQGETNQPTNAMKPTITPIRAVPILPDRRTARDKSGEPVNRQIRTLPRAVHGKEPKRGDTEIV